MTPGLLLITGGDGQLAQISLRHKGERQRMHLTYLYKPVATPGHEVVQLDITNFDQLLNAMQGVASVVHLPADSAGQGPWESVLPNNIETHDHPTLKTVDDCQAFVCLDLTGVPASIR